MSLFDDTNRRLSTPNEVCYAVTTLTVQAYNATVFYQLATFESNFWHLITSCVFTRALLRFFFHQLLSLKRIVPKNMKTLH